VSATTVEAHRVRHKPWFSGTQPVLLDQPRGSSQSVQLSHFMAGGLNCNMLSIAVLYNDESNVSLNCKRRRYYSVVPSNIVKANGNNTWA
jgi:hypothetical protein